MATKRFLITTALEETWSTNLPIIFLGEWCKLYDKRNNWESLEYTTAQYIWDDRDLLFKDYNYCIELYEKLLPIVGVELNKAHKVNYDSRFWRILIGPWLIFFIQILRERWQQIQSIISIDASLETIISVDDQIEIPLDMSQFSSYFISDSWNYCIYSYIIKNYTNISYSEYNITLGTNSKQLRKNKSWLIRNLYRLLYPFNRAKNYILIDVIPDKVQLIKTFFSFGILDFRFPNYDFPPNEKKDRIVINLDYKPNNLFEECLINLIPLQIPKIYLDWFNGASNFSQLFKNLRGIDSIVTTNVYYNDLLKFWIAKNTTNNIKLVTFQHGGGYGIGKWFVNEYHEKSISDIFLTWGWGDKKSYNVNSFYFLKSNPYKDKFKVSNENILLVLTALPRYSYKLFSEPVSSQFLHYIESQISFLKLLPDSVFSKIIVRKYFNDYDWNVSGRIKEILPNIKISNPNTSLTALIRKSKIVIVTNNSTTYIESLEANFPTIIFWDKRFWELRAEAIEAFEELKNVGIIHFTEESAASHLSNIYPNIMQWWLSDEVQKVRYSFVTKYANSKIGGYNLIPIFLNNLN